MAQYHKFLNLRSVFWCQLAASACSSSSRCPTWSSCGWKNVDDVCLQCRPPLQISPAISNRVSWSRRWALKWLRGFDDRAPQRIVLPFLTIASCPVSEPLRFAIFGTTCSIFNLWSRPWGTDCWVSMEDVHFQSRVALPPRKHKHEILRFRWFNIDNVASVELWESDSQNSTEVLYHQNLFQ